VHQVCASINQSKHLYSTTRREQIAGADASGPGNPKPHSLRKCSSSE